MRAFKEYQFSKKKKSNICCLRLIKFLKSFENEMYIFSGSRYDWYEYTNEWEKEMNKKKTNYLCLYYEEIKKVNS